jgi:hypothetical protein
MILPIKAAVLTGWRDKLSTGLWQVPLCKQVDNVNTDTQQLSNEQS